MSRYILDLLVEPVVLLARRLGARMTGSKNDGARDSLEMELIRDGVKTNLPLLGICRGEQLLNVFFGGTLHQALKNFYTEVPEMITVFPRKRIEVVPGTLLARCLGHAPGPVNALHRQGVHQVGRGLVVSARDKNGIIQAIEHEALPFVLGVQWHPEYLPQVGEQRAIFRALVEQAKAHALHLPTKAATSTSSASAVTAAFLAACSIAPIADAPEFFGRPWLPI